MTKEDIGVRLRSERESQGLTLRQVASRARISVSQVANIEHGRQCTDDSIEAVAAALGYDLLIERLLVPRGARVRPVVLPNELANAVSDILARETDARDITAALLRSIAQLDGPHLRIVKMQVEAMVSGLARGLDALRR